MKCGACRYDCRNKDHQRQHDPFTVAAPLAKRQASKRTQAADGKHDGQNRKRHKEDGES